MKLRVACSVHEVLHLFARHGAIANVRCQAKDDADDRECVGEGIWDEQPVGFVVVAIYVGGQLDSCVGHVAVLISLGFDPEMLGYLRQ